MIDVDQKIEAIRQDVANFSAPFEGFKVTDAESQAKGTQAALEIRKRVKRIEELRTFFVKPLNDQVKQINSLFQAETEPLKVLSTKIDTELKTYFIAEEKKREEELQAKLKAQREEEALAAKLKSEAEAAGLPMPEIKTPTVLEVTDSVEVVPTSTKTAAGTMSYKKVWKWEVESEEVLRANHPELFILDEKAVNALVKNGEREVKGLRIFQDVQTSGRV